MVDGLAPLPAFPAFQRLLRSDNQQLVAKFQARPTVDKEIQYFRDKAPKLESIDDLFKDKRLLRFITSAYSLDEELQFPGRLRKVLESKTTDPNSLANRLVDPRYGQIQRDLLLGDIGIISFSNTTLIDKIVNRYVQNEFEKDLGNTNPALREASYFLRTIGSIKNSLNILGDGVLRNVVTFTLDLPPQIAFQSIEKQRALIDARLDVTKFINGSTTSNGTRTIDQANADIPAIDNGLALTSAASKQVQTVISRLQSLKDDYARLANIQNPTGPFASEIPIQEAAAPELTRFSGLLTTAQDAINQIAPKIQRAAELITLARDSANASHIADYKAEFADIAADIRASITGANYSFDNNDPDSAGTPQNLLDGSLPATLSVQTTSAGDTVSIRGQNLGGLLTAIDQANADFQAVSGTGDTANLDAAQSSATIAGDAYNASTITLAADQKALSDGISRVGQWAATFNTGQLYPGHQALRDAGSRAAQLKLAIDQIRTLAQTSAGRADGADRSDITGEFADLVAQVSSLVNTAGNGFDNLLNGGSKSYELINGVFLQARGRDLNTSVVSPLTSGNIDTAAGAQAVLDALTATVDPALSQAAHEIATDVAPFATAAGSLDPRAAIDSRYRSLTEEIGGIVNGAAVGKDNLLLTTQDDVSVKVQTSGHTVTINAQTGFDAGVTQIIEAGADLLPSSATDISGALAKINEALFNANRTLSLINADTRSLNVERSLAQAVVNAADKPATSSQSFQATDFAIQFIRKYLIKRDLEAASQNTGIGSLVSVLGNSQNSGLLSSIATLTSRGRSSFFA